MKKTAIQVLLVMLVLSWEVFAYLSLPEWLQEVFWAKMWTNIIMLVCLFLVFLSTFVDDPDAEESIEIEDDMPEHIARERERMLAGQGDFRSNLPLLRKFFLSIAGVCFLYIGFQFYLAFDKKMKLDAAYEELHHAPLREIRNGYKTVLTREDPYDYSSDLPREKSGLKGIKRVTYESEAGELKAWVIIPAQKKEKYPAVVYINSKDLEIHSLGQVLPFVENGFIVMLPALRGQNGNPGRTELCYGEVNDAIAALEYLSERKRVDSSMLFSAGHFSGGTTVMLLAESTKLLKGAAAIGAHPDMKATGAFGKPPFEVTDKELELRSPARYLDDLSCPLLLLYPAGTPHSRQRRADVSMLSQAKEMAEQAAKSNKTVKVEMIKNADNSMSIAKGIPKMVSFFKSLMPETESEISDQTVEEEPEDISQPADDPGESKGQTEETD